jgi:hypothetical protein
MRHHERGQVFPLWIGAIVTTFMFAFLALNYANTVRWQIRAQNAADSVAQGLMALQAERFNEVNVALYGTGVEEYRIRHLLDGILTAANDSGGCAASYDPSLWNNSSSYTSGFLPGTCSRVYDDLSAEFVASLNRYTNDAKLLNDYSNESTYANWTNDTSLLITHMSNSTHCNNAGQSIAIVDGTDCKFQYTILAQAQRTGLLAVQQDAQNILVPGLGRTSTIGPDLENKGLFAPAKIDIAACQLIPPVIPNFGALHFVQQYAIGRAAATTVQFEEDWLQPGAIYDPAGRPVDTLFQPDEPYSEFVPGTDSTESYNWYGVNFGGNAAVAYVNYGAFDEPTYVNEYSVRVGWWNSIAIKPFAATPSVASICPAS